MASFRFAMHTELSLKSWRMRTGSWERGGALPWAAPKG